MTTTIQDEIEALIDASDHIEAFRTLINQYIQFSSKRKRLIAQLKAIEERTQDPILHLVVLGEFSCGKSSLINGFLGRLLLKASCKATTASATHIVPGNSFSISATFSDGNTISGKTTGYKKLKDRIHKILPDVSPNVSLKEILHLLTSEKVVSDEVERIHVEYPSNLLIKDIEIIDTPGIGAGANEAKNHIEVIRDVIDNHADNAIVLTSALSPATNTLLNFLENHISSFLHRCVFIITQMDRLDKEDRESTVLFVKNALAEKLGLDNPPLCQVSAFATVPEVQDSFWKDNSRDYWRKQFEQLTETLRQTMVAQRNIIISEHLVRLLKELTKELRDELKGKKSILEKEKKILNQGSVEVIETVTSQLLENSKAKIKKAIESVKLQCKAQRSKFASKAKSKSSSAIISAGWGIKKFENDVAPNIDRIMDSKASSYLSLINKKLGEVKRVASDVCKEFEKNFSEHYSMFPSIGVKVETQSISIASLTVSGVRFHAANQYVSNQNDEDAGGGTAGAIVGGIIGFFLGGPPGAAAGAAIGGSAGYGVAGDSLEDRQQKLKSLINSEINSFFKRYQSQLLSQLSKLQNSIFSQLKKAAKKHIEQYGDDVSAMIEKHRQNEARLISEISKIDADSRDLSQRQKRLDKNQTQLSNRLPRR